MAGDTDIFTFASGRAQFPSLEEFTQISDYPGMWSFERAAWRMGFRLTAGIDEAGRGPLAGPVVAAAVVLPSDFDPTGIKDSKVLTQQQRELAFQRICREAHAVGLGIVGPDVIDKINILQATWLAMNTAAHDLRLTPEICLIDGSRIPRFDFPHKEIVKGDSRSVSIAAASIIAKVTRDRLMQQLEERYPGYGFGKHKGYATSEHLTALARLGSCPEHRLSFQPCASVTVQQTLQLEGALA